MGLLDNKRITEITIVSSSDTKLLGAKFTLDVYGNPTACFNGLPHKWVFDEVIKKINGVPHISGTKTVDVLDQNGRVYATALVEKYVDITYGEAFDTAAKAYPFKDAVVDITAGRRITYGELKKKSDHLARKLMDLQIEKGSSVAVMMLNSLEIPLSKLAATKAGAVVVNISPFESPAVLETLLKRADVNTIILKTGVKGEENLQALYDICPELATAEPGNLCAEKLPALKTVIVVGSDKEYPGTIKFEELFASKPVCTCKQLKERMCSVSSRDAATVIHTSGTTGTPKGVVLRHSALAENAAEHVKQLQITPDDVIFMPVPMFHAFGCIGSAYTAFIAGATLVCADRPKPDKIMQLLNAEKCTVMLAVPSLYIALIDYITNNNLDTSGLCLHNCVMAGAKCSEKTINELRDVLHIKDVLIMYGMTEAGPGVTGTSPGDSIEVKTNTVGKPWPGVEVMLQDKFVNGDGMECGEICVRGYNVMVGYYKDPFETSKSIDMDGWLHTGDIGCIRDDGNLMICGRIKDVIIKNGENISPSEIEEILLAHEKIAEVFVVGAQDYRFGEAIFAFIRLKADCTLTEQEVLEFCKKNMATIKIPQHVEFVESYPVSATGKVLRRELRVIADNINKTLNN